MRLINQVLAFFALVGMMTFVTGCTTSAQMSSDVPLPNAASRATPLSFGMYVTPDPATNPIDPPEEFTGYHAGLDLEVSKGELDGDVPVSAICRGKIAYSGFVDGYGGLVVQRCNLDGSDVTVLYGHLKIEGLPKTGTTLKTGQTFALLGDARSRDTDGNRKHLHVGIHKGTAIDYRGYVQSETELSQFVDPKTLLPKATIDLPGDGPREVPYWQE